MRVEAILEVRAKSDENKEKIDGGLIVQKNTNRPCFHYENLSDVTVALLDACQRFVFATFLVFSTVLRYQPQEIKDILRAEKQMGSKFPSS